MVDSGEEATLIKQLSDATALLKEVQLRLEKASKTSSEENRGTPPATAKQHGAGDTPISECRPQVLFELTGIQKSARELKEALNNSHKVFNMEYEELLEDVQQLCARCEGLGKARHEYKA